jgi:hypothetical protein
MKFANTRVLEETMYRVIPKGWGVPEIALAVPPWPYRGLLFQECLGLRAFAGCEIFEIILIEGFQKTKCLQEWVFYFQKCPTCSFTL